MKWLYDSHGSPLGFIAGKDVFLASGLYFGKIDGTEVWHGRYRGEIVGGDRLLRRRDRPSTTRPHGGHPATPSVPVLKPRAKRLSLPDGFDDISMEVPWVELT